MTGRCPFHAVRIYAKAADAHKAVRSKWTRLGERWELYSCPDCMEIHIRQVFAQGIEVEILAVSGEIGTESPVAS